MIPGSSPCHESQVKCPTDSLLLYITPSLHNLNIHLPFLSLYRMLQLYVALASCRLTLHHYILFLCSDNPCGDVHTLQDTQRQKKGEWGIWVGMQRALAI